MKKTIPKAVTFRYPDRSDTNISRASCDEDIHACPQTRHSQPYRSPLICRTTFTCRQASFDNLPRATKWAFSRHLLQYIDFAPGRSVSLTNELRALWAKSANIILDTPITPYETIKHAVSTMTFALCLFASAPAQAGSMTQDEDAITDLSFYVAAVDMAERFSHTPCRYMLPRHYSTKQAIQEALAILPPDLARDIYPYLSSPV